MKDDSTENREIEEIRRYAETGNVRAQFLLGNRLLGGEGIGKNREEGIEWLQKAARQDPDCASRLGYLYLYGDGVPRNLRLAAEWFKKSGELAQRHLFEFGPVQPIRENAKLGDRETQWQWAQICLAGRGGVQSSRDEGIKWLKEAARQGHPEAQHMLGDCYYYGRGTEPDDSQAVQWYRLAVRAGLLKSKHALANCYYTGRGVGQDYREAIRWFQKGAIRGFGPSQYALGECYYHGHGVMRDRQTAVRFYRRAARHRAGQSAVTSKARWKLGLCYMNGKGVRQDPFESAKWFIKAIEEGSEEAVKEIGKLNLTAAQETELFNRH